MDCSQEDSMNHAFPRCATRQYLHNSTPFPDFGRGKKHVLLRLMAALTIGILFMGGIAPSVGWSLASAPPIPEGSIQLQPLTSHTFEEPVFFTPYPGDPSRFINWG